MALRLQKRPELAKKRPTSSPKYHDQNITFQNSYTTEWLPDHNSGLNWPKNVQNHLKNVTVHSGRGPDSYFIGNQPLCFREMTLSKLLELRRGLPDHKVAPRQQKRPESAKKYPNTPKDYHVVRLWQGIRQMLHSCVSLGTRLPGCFPFKDHKVAFGPQKSADLP